MPGPGRTAAESPRSCSCTTRRRQAGRSSLRRGAQATSAGGYSRCGCVGRRLTTRAARALTSGERPSLPSPLHSLAFFPHPQVSPLFSFVMHFFSSSLQVGCGQQFQVLAGRIFQGTFSLDDLPCGFLSSIFSVINTLTFSATLSFFSQLCRLIMMLLNLLVHSY